MRSLGVKTEVKPAAKDRVSLIPKLMLFLRYGFTFSRFIKYLCLYLYTPVNLPAGVIFISSWGNASRRAEEEQKEFFGSYRKDEVSTHIQAFPEGTAQENNLSINSHLMRVGQGVLPYHILGGVQLHSQVQTAAHLRPTVLVHNLLPPVRQQSRLLWWPCGLLDAWAASHL